jgi:hypothetical protein
VPEIEPGEILEREAVCGVCPTENKKTDVAFVLPGEPVNIVNENPPLVFLAFVVCPLITHR